jgi:putative oxidoreductase
MLNENVMSAPDKLVATRNLLQEHGNNSWLTSSGNFGILDNWIEFAMTYFFMLLSLFLRVVVSSPVSITFYV